MQSVLMKCRNVEEKPFMMCAASVFRYLSNNKISVLQPGVLDHLGSTLQVLRLSRNRISQIPVKALQLPRLTQL